MLKFSVSQGIESIMEWGRVHPDKKQIIPDILQNVVCLCEVGELRGIHKKCKVIKYTKVF